nr:putative reverse transcriptase domain-containing protein [Tanacetum cinerariifolium]
MRALQKTLGTRLDMIGILTFGWLSFLITTVTTRALNVHLLKHCTGETTKKIMKIKERLKTTRSHQKNYADKRRKPLEFKVGDRVLLKVSPGKRVVQFGKKGKLAYLHVPLEEIKVNDKLYFVEEPVEIVDRQVKKLKRSWIPIVKVRWDSRSGAEFTWEREDQFKAKYPHLFATLPSATGGCDRNQCLQGWKERKKTYSIGWEVKEEVCPHARVTLEPNDTRTSKGKQKVVTKVLVQEKRNPFPESVTTKRRLYRE